MTIKKRKIKKKPSVNNPTLILIFVGLIGLALTIYIGYRASISERRLFSVSLISIFAGLLFESIRVSGNWKTVFAIFVGTYLLSLFAFLPGKREHTYNFENHIEMWPYFFIFIFSIIFGAVYKDKVTAKLTEGITLMLSISLIYWAVDYGFINYHNWFSISLMVIGAILSILSVVHALTHIHLSRTNRLALSIWSTVIMFAFAIDNIIRVFSNPDIENSYFSDALYIGIQYFLLGVSAVYIMQNYMLLAAFFPSKHGKYKQNLEEIKKDHIDRYSDEQVSIAQSTICIIVLGVLYILNYKFQILPRHTMIWLVFLTFPFILHLTTVFNGQKTTANKSIG